MTGAVLYKNNGVVFPTLGFPIFYRMHYRCQPALVLDIHIDVFLLKKCVQTGCLSFPRLRSRSVNTQRKLKTNSSLPQPLQPTKRPRPTRRTPEVDPSGTKPEKRTDWTIVFFAPFPPAPPPLVANKRDGLCSFFRTEKEWFLLL